MIGALIIRLLVRETNYERRFVNGQEVCGFTTETNQIGVAF